MSDTQLNNNILHPCQGGERKRDKSSNSTDFLSHTPTDHKRLGRTTTTWKLSGVDVSKCEKGEILLYFDHSHHLTLSYNHFIMPPPPPSILFNEKRGKFFISIILKFFLSCCHVLVIIITTIIISSFHSSISHTQQHNSHSHQHIEPCLSISISYSLFRKQEERCHANNHPS